ncbi:DeoR/GlpR family DNA-binding transcription regulator [Albimonas pacifica]|uniref:Transcriptional regulator, DeoR family n=1 Tax=Albimonas pacifica TaxID=1114924 RepID=A0A1I3J249_9RHOB|nr:DeoR/GlpR family DNA-binding transcription regulator [Albimonas pacifica]SFI54280.1 transcriptional regulator, DeoR family [Albimonas pacifica]
MDRRTRILAAAQRHGRVTVEGLAEALGVSAHTIRRDLAALCEAAKLRRLHGGAEYIEGGANLPYEARSALNLGPKRAIAAAAARLVPDGATVFLSVGTTPAMVAEALAGREGLVAVTNNLNAALALAANPSHRIILPGGELRLPDRDLLGPAALELIAGYRADLAIYGVGGVDADGSLLDFHADEVAARQAMRANSRRTILVADRSKFGRRAAAVGGRLEEADHVVIDARPGPEHAGLLAPLGDRLLVAAEIEARLQDGAPRDRSAATGAEAPARMTARTGACA